MKPFFTFRACLLVVLLGLSLSAFSQTEIAGGNITSTTWTAANSPYNINGNITVPDANTLTIEPGVIVNVTGNYFIRIEGTLSAIGTATDTILFTAENTSAGWNGLKISSAETNDTTKLGYVQVQYSNNRGVYILNTDKVVFDHCQLNNNWGTSAGGLLVSGSDIKISNSTFFSNRSTSSHGGGVYITVSTVDIVNCLIRNNTSYKYGGGLMYSSSKVNLINSTIVNNTAQYGGGMLLWSNSYVNIYNSVIWGNSASSDGNNIHVHTSHAFMSNTAIIAGASSIHVPSSTGSTLTYSSNSFAASCIALHGTNTESTGPNFTDPVNHNYTFSAASPLVNAGAIYGIESSIGGTDLAGAERILQGCIDIGVYESNHFRYVMASIPVNYGTVTPLSKQYAGGEEHTYTIIPATYSTLGSAEYNSVDILGELSTLTGTSTYTIASVSEHGELAVSFDLKDYTVNETAIGNGTISPSGETTVTYADITDFTLSPAADHEIAEASYNSNNIMSSLVESGDDYIYTLQNVAADGELNVRFAQFYDVKAADCEYATITPDSTHIEENTAHAFSITPDLGYEITSALYNGADISSELVEASGVYTYSIPSVAEDGELVVTCEPIEYTITASSSLNGTINPSGDSTMSIVDETVYTISSDADFEIAEASIGSVNIMSSLVKAGDSYTFTLNKVSQDSVINIRFAPFFDIVAEDCEYASISPDSVHIELGSTHVISIQASDGFQISGAVYNGTDVIDELIESEAVLTYTIPSVSENGRLVVETTPINYTINASAGSNGSISPIGDSVVSVLDTVVYTITADTDYRIKEVVANGDTLLTEQLEIRDVTNDFSIVASFDSEGTNIFDDTLSNQIWTKANSPYYITNNIHVPYTNSLIIEPGVEIIMTGNYSFKVEGFMLAEGSNDDTIKFTSRNGTGWQGIEIDPGVLDTTKLVYVQIENSKATALYLNNADRTIIDHCLFNNNSASRGGAIKAENTNTIISNTTFRNNSALDDGGAVYTNGGYIYFVNNLFDQNSTGDEGGAIYANMSHIYSTNNTFVKNSAGYGGGAIAFHDAGGSIISNCIFWNNTGPWAGRNLYYNGSGGHLQYSALQSGTQSIELRSSSITYEGGSFDQTNLNLKSANSTDTIQYFADPDAGDYRLDWQSNLINIGDTTDLMDQIPTHDMLGKLRIQQDFIDLGAFESNHEIVFISVQAGEHGYIAPADGKAPLGGSRTFTIVPDVGYHIDSVWYNNVDITNQAVAGDTAWYIIADGIAAIDILKASFAINHYVVRTIAGENGSITPDSIVVEHGGSVSFVATPNEGYLVDLVFYNDVNDNSNITFSGNVMTFSKDNIIMDGELNVSFWESAPDMSVTDLAEEVTMDVYPNPVSDLLTISVRSDAITAISLIDISGKTVYSETKTGQERVIDCSDLNQGIYVLQVQTENDIYTQRIVKK